MGLFSRLKSCYHHYYHYLEVITTIRSYGSLNRSSNAGQRFHRAEQGGKLSSMNAPIPPEDTPITPSPTLEELIGLVFSGPDRSHLRPKKINRPTTETIPLDPELPVGEPYPMPSE